MPDLLRVDSMEEADMVAKFATNIERTSTVAEVSVII
jgi:hypothetical protein